MEKYFYILKFKNRTYGEIDVEHHTHFGLHIETRVLYSVLIVKMYVHHYSTFCEVWYYCN